MHDDDFGGLDLDLKATMSRRQALRLALGASLIPIVGSASPAPAASDGLSNSTTGGACDHIPPETAGPYPGNGSNGPDVLALSGVVRSDITTSFGGLSGTVDGIPLSVTLTIVSTNSCAPLEGYAVYLWHCDRDGQYSLYSSGVTNQNWLRGVQVADAGGALTFSTVFPGCYPGRWPHMHFEVYPSESAASDVGNKIATSQLALPKASCDEVYATANYSQSATNLASLSLATDNVFSDGAQLQIATITGNATSGYAATLTVAVDESTTPVNQRSLGWIKSSYKR